MRALSSFHQSWKTLILASQRCNTVKQIKSTHSLFIIHGLNRNTYAISKLLTAFLHLPNLNKHFHYASAIFDSIEIRNSFVYDTMIRICSRSSLPHLGLRYFRLMVSEDEEEEDIAPSYLTFHFLIVACLKACLFSVGKQIHCWVIKNGVFLSDGHVQTGVLRIYVEDKVLVDARKVFDEIPEPDVVKWDVLMNGYVRCGLGSEGLELFKEMLVRGIEPDEFSVTTGLTACAQVGALSQGKWIHEFVKKKKKIWIKSDVFVGTALVDMYAKCGCIETAVEVFEKLSKRNVFSWAALIGGYAAYGYAKKAIMCLSRIEDEDAIKPDSVVLLGVLAACAHGGFLQEGRTMLENMEARYGITPKHEHYSCIVDLMCRAGRLNDAVGLIEKMPMKPLASVWGALLNGCRTHKNVELGELAVRNLLELEKGNADEEEAALVQLSNIYFSAQRNLEASKIRGMIDQKGIRKALGCSVLEVDGNVSTFVSGDVSHPEIHTVIHLLSVDALQIL
ncbi:PREDICTED: putative pentatricopeptide repeat-containing protein At3g28640 [Camelina sativa]|uniref:Pentatricopeptide repeat-containing protein At3g28640 n=1 Tax=Camelina sativa TaxID=90675 RepID=A0ABM1RT81_CAMSA|nr:PREDICTED: putative pentatricopeptide repeat-containing protein At3g28640 [Camelina sativa]XP_010514572.1 PREDICTED: putative pentatricopeptide repeat-containing protein At3g28640 [Camelina sativa]XP_019102219.1 PREDICTED: putative pentatricopeptide repeat-containing protein At3g28640 [Camelina sativa]